MKKEVKFLKTNKKEIKKLKGTIAVQKELIKD